MYKESIKIVSIFIKSMALIAQVNKWLECFSSIYIGYIVRSTMIFLRRTRAKINFR